MIRVIERHDYHIHGKITCNNCGSILEYSIEDIRNYGDCNRKCILCPVCGYIIELKGDNNE